MELKLFLGRHDSTELDSLFAKLQKKGFIATSVSGTMFDFYPGTTRLILAGGAVEDCIRSTIIVAKRVGIDSIDFDIPNLRTRGEVLANRKNKGDRGKMIRELLT